MHLESPAQRKGHVHTLGMLEAVFQEVGKRFPEIGMGAVLDDEPCALFGSEPAQISKALLRHENLGVVFHLIYMAHVGHDAGNCSALGH